MNTQYLHSHLTTLILTGHVLVMYSCIQSFIDYCANYDKHPSGGAFAYSKDDEGNTFVSGQYFYI